MAPLEGNEVTAVSTWRLEELLQPQEIQPPPTPSSSHTLSVQEVTLSGAGVPPRNVPPEPPSKFPQLLLKAQAGPFGGEINEKPMRSWAEGSVPEMSRGGLPGSCLRPRRRSQETQQLLVEVGDASREP